MLPESSENRVLTVGFKIAQACKLIKYKVITGFGSV